MKELCALPISDFTEKNAVLFLWVTSPFLEKVFKYDLLVAWGFVPPQLEMEKSVLPLI